MKLLSLPLPGFSGMFRGCGRPEIAEKAEFVDDCGGEGKMGWRKPPGSDVEVMGDVEGELLKQRRDWRGLETLALGHLSQRHESEVEMVNVS